MRIRPAAIFLAGVLLTLAACDPASPAAGGPGSAPAAAPATTASPAPTGPTKDESCKAVTMALINGSVGIADDAVKSIDDRWSTKKVNTAMRARFATMQKQVAAESAKIVDPALKASVDQAAAQLSVGAKASDPGKFLKKDFQTLGKSIDKTCGNG